MELTRRSFSTGLASAVFAPLARAIPPRPKLLILLVAGQFRPDYFDSHAGTFGTGGFQRLLSGGAYFPNCFLDSTSFTASGLATIGTGAYPGTHGIVADRWYDHGKHEIVSATADLVEGTTLASEFLAADPRNRVHGVGFDSRVTRILCKVTPHTSFAPDAPAKFQWSALGSKGTPPMRIVDPANGPDFAALWKSSPASQAAQFSFARDLIGNEKLGRGEGLDLLYLHLESLGALGLETGANSPLLYDLVSQLDVQIEALLKFLDESVGENAYQVVFTAAHGVPDAAAQRIAAKSVVARIEKAAAVEAYVYPILNLRSGDPRAAAEASGAAAWYTVDGACSHTGLLHRRLQNSFHPNRSGDAILAYPPNCVEDWANGRGVSYGSIYNYDTCVPLILYGPQFRAVEIEDSVELTDIAPTLARVLGTGLPSSSTGRVLGEAFLGGTASPRR